MLHLRAVLIILVDHRNTRRKSTDARKEFRLRARVGFHRAMEVEVILSEVSEDRDIDREAPDTLLLECVGAHLHDCSGTSGLHAFCKDRVDVAALGRRVISWANLAGDVCLDGAEQNAFAADAGEKLFEEEGCRRLAVGSGDGTEFELTFRVAEDCSAHLSERPAATLHKRDWKIRMRALESLEDLIRVGDDGCDALLQCSVDKAVSVCRAAAHCHEDIAGANATRVIVHTAYLGVTTCDLQRPQLRSDVVPSHRAGHQIERRTQREKRTTISVPGGTIVPAAGI